MKDKAKLLSVVFILWLLIFIAGWLINKKIEDWYFRSWLCEKTKTYICINTFPPPAEEIERMNEIGKREGKNF